MTTIVRAAGSNTLIHSSTLHTNGTTTIMGRNDERVGADYQSCIEAWQDSREYAALDRSMRTNRAPWL